MSQNMRYYCDRCGRSVYNVEINGVRVPLLFYFVVGQPPDTGERVDTAKIPVPAFIRELMSIPTPRVELCIECVSAVFGQPVEAPMTDEEVIAMSTTHPKMGTQLVAPSVARAADLPVDASQSDIDRAMKQDVLYAIEHKKHPPIPMKIADKKEPIAQP